MSLLALSIELMIEVGSLIVHMVYVGSAENVELTRVSQSAIDSHMLVIFNRGKKSLILGLVIPIGSPRYVNGKSANLQTKCCSQLSCFSGFQIDG